MLYHKVYFISTDLPEIVKIELTRNVASATMTCTAEARPEASFQIFRNETGELVWNGATYTIEGVNKSHVGYYKCVAENDLGKATSDLEYLAIEGKISLERVF